MGCVRTVRVSAAMVGHTRRGQTLTVLGRLFSVPHQSLPVGCTTSTALNGCVRIIWYELSSLERTA